jgi:tRNA pseudouridine38-40 synthase
VTTFKITLAYDGTTFVGWQRQAAGTSIQGLLEEALAGLDQSEVIVFGAGRTDAGVHALGQVASFSLKRTIEGPNLVRSLNASLPDTIRVLAADVVPDTFHARYDARRKTYRYRLWNADVLNPFERQYVWHVYGSLDRDAMAAAAGLIEGRHDFAAFRATSGRTRSSDREVFSSRVIAAPCPPFPPCPPSPPRPLHPSRPLLLPLIVYEISGSGFLRHMVRNVVGTLVEIGRGRRPIAWMSEVLEGRDRMKAGPTAPARGLLLVSVEYDADLLAPER